MQFRVLVVDDEPSITRSLDRVLTDRGYQVFTAATGAEGLGLVEKERPHIVLLDVRLPDASGFDLIARIHKVETATQVIVLTGYGDTQAVVRAMKLGAGNFLRKPYDLEELISAVDAAARDYSRDAHLLVYRRKDRGLYNPDEIIYRSEAMKKIWDLVRMVARSDASTILVTGETGTGKELVARGLHFEGARRVAPFMHVNCSALPEALLENELFGHEKGAFTSATFRKRGLVELSDGGTLLLDEIGEMSPPTQAKLLRFLEERTFRRLGGSVDIGVNIRIVAATNVDLERRIRDERFRADLYYRLQVVSIHLPPLRERGEDTCLLAEFFLRRFATEMRKKFRVLDDAVRDLFLAYPWPGNIRELRNVIERIVLVEDDEVLGVHHLPTQLVERARAGEAVERAVVAGAGIASAVADSDVIMRPLRDVQDDHVRAVLDACGGNKSRAARVLGLSRQGLFEYLRRMDHRSGTALSERTLH